MELAMNPVKIIDRPCGTGKTTSLLKSFEHDKKYIVIVPYLSEVTRVIGEADCDFYEPVVEGETTTKISSLIQLAIEGKNIATTHKMFESLVSVCRKGYLKEYHLVIDEVPDPVKVAYQLSKASLNEIYLGGGYIQVDYTGLVSTSEKWQIKQFEFNDTLSPKLMNQAATGCLYLSENQYFLLCMPSELLTSCQTTTILTYKSEGSILCKYLDKEGIPYVVDSSVIAEEEFRSKARELISINSLTTALTSFKWSHSKQALFSKTDCDKVKVGLKNLRSTKLVGVDQKDILFTCRKSLWFDEYKGPKIKNGSRINNANWVSNTTRGTNLYSHCSHAIYLYDQNVNPVVARWLGIKDLSSFNDNYALTELIQWLYRSRVRKGEPIDVYFASDRMKSILMNWLGY